MPDAVDFDTLWYRVHKRVLEELDDQAVRADADAGAFVVAELIQRLAVADLAMTSPKRVPRRCVASVLLWARRQLSAAPSAAVTASLTAEGFSAST